MACPNCGQAMETLKTARQEAGSRTVDLEWLICDHCHHVALGHWAFTDPDPAPDSSQEEPPRATTRA